MPAEQIQALPVSELAGERCHLFIWTTSKFIPLALDCLKAYGFDYKFMMVWHKQRGPQPVGWPCHNAEFVVYGHRGKTHIGRPGFLDTKQFRLCFQGSYAGHSVKPVEFYELLERITPAPRIDLFARRRHAGFDAWGNQVE